MEILIKAAQLVLSLSLLILLHEMGHFFPAKWFKTRVEKFYLFFDPWFSLIKFKRGETEYGIGWLPLGGYVKISGMMDESMDKEQMAEEPKPWEFRSKPAWQRLIILSGDVIVNFILGFLIYSMVLFSWGSKHIPLDSMEGGMSVRDSLALDLGFQTGDELVSINSVAPTYWDEVLPMLLVESADATVIVNRDGQEVKIDIPKDFIGQIVDRAGQRSILSVRVPTVIAELNDEANPNAKNAGILPGDQIVGINDFPTPYFDVFYDSIHTMANQRVDIQLVRNGERLTLPCDVDSSGTIGFKPAGKFEDLYKAGLLDMEIRHYSFFESFPAGFALAGKQLNFYIQQVKLVLTPSTGAYKGVGGFAAIGNLFPSEWSWESFWNITAFLSLMLGFMNVLPIPALDGGHIMFVLWEMITGRKPNEKFMEYAQIAGFFFLVSLILLVNGNDFYRFVFK